MIAEGGKSPSSTQSDKTKFVYFTSRSPNRKHNFFKLETVKTLYPSVCLTLFGLVSTYIFLKHSKKDKELNEFPPNREQVSVSVRYLSSANGWKDAWRKLNMDSSFSRKENPNMEKGLFDWSINYRVAVCRQSEVSRKLESSRAWSFFPQAFAQAWFPLAT